MILNQQHVSGKDDTFNILGGSGISTSATGDTVTIINTEQAPNVFKNIQVAGQSQIVAESNADTLTFVAGFEYQLQQIHQVML